MAGIASGPLDFGVTRCYTKTMLDGGVVIGYFVAWLVGRTLDTAADAALERLGRRVRDRVGPQRTEELKERPRDRRIRGDAKRQIEDAMRRDRALQAELQEAVRNLDAHGGRVVIVPEYPSNPFVIGLLLLGIALCVIGLGMAMFSVFDLASSNAPPQRGFPPGTVIGFELFFGGFVVLILAGVLHGFTRNR